MLTRCINILREHIHFIVVVTVLIVVMTFPTILYVFDTEVFWLPTGNHPDTWGKFWDAWYGQKVLSGQADLYYTDLLFYPRGSSLTFHNFSWPHMLVLSGLQAIMPASNAYSLTFLLIVASVTCSSYLYMLYLFHDKWLALLGAVIVGLSPQVVGYPEHPELRFIATVPLALYFFHRGFAERRYRHFVFSGLTTGATAYVSMHVAVVLVFALSMYAIYFLYSSWREAASWRFIALFSAIAIAVSAARVLPMIASLEALEQSVAVRHGQEIGNDLLEYFVNARHPFVENLLPEQSFLWGLHPSDSRFASYIGYSVILLIAVGLWAKNSRRKVIAWIALAAPFLFLRLGSTLTVGGEHYQNIVLPKHFLDEWLPGVTESFTMTNNFYIGALVPMAALACIGASTILRAAKPGRRPIIVLLMVGTVCFEYYQPVRPGVLTDKELEFLEWLDDEPGDVRLIDLPMRGRSRRQYSFHQSLHGYPVAGGIVARTPPLALQYIHDNYLLNSWSLRYQVSCTWRKQDKYLRALNQLNSAGFSHLVLHRSADDADLYSDSFLGQNPSYHDDYVSIFRLTDLIEACTEEFVEEVFAGSLYAGVYLSPSIIHERNGAVVSFHPSQMVHEELLPYVSHKTYDQRTAIHITRGRNSNLVIQSSNDLFSDLNSLAEMSNGVWLILDPKLEDVAQMAKFGEWLLPHYKFCVRYINDEDASVDLYLKHGIPCEAGRDQGRHDLLYDNGIRLHDWYFSLDTENITFYMQWTTRTESTYSFSIQLFDRFGEKVHQYDAIIPRQPVAVHAIDVSGLPDGEYLFKLIVYDFETGLSESGSIENSELRFERELEIATIEIGQETDLAHIADT